MVEETGFGMTTLKPGNEVYAMPWFPRADDQPAVDRNRLTSTSPDRVGYPQWALGRQKPDTNQLADIRRKWT
jgi:hypothetical protein